MRCFLSGYSRSAATPDLGRRLDDERELALLVVRGNPVAFYRAREPALRAQREPLERNEPRRLVDAALELVLRLEPRLLGGDEPEHRGLPRAEVAERLERAGARRVVLDEEPVHVDLPEGDLGHRVVAALGQPRAHVVAAA